jgi:hypothetical protein
MDIAKLNLKNCTGKPIKNVDLVLTTYSLLLYLLYKPIEEIEQTAFFCMYCLPKDITDRLPNSIYIEKPNESYRNIFEWIISFIKEKENIKRKFPFLKESKFYGADHNGIFDSILSTNQICVVEDGLGLYYPPKDPKIKTITKLLYTLLGKNYKGFYGRGKHCSKILYTNMFPLDIREEKLIEINSYQLWLKDKNKQKKILDLFGLIPDDLKAFDDKTVIVLTEPMEEFGMSEMEKIKLYENAIMNLDKSKIIFKNHPRDHTDYSKFISGVACCRSFIPMELISFFHPSFEMAITYNSTSIFSLDKNVKKIILDDKFKKLV